MTQNKAYTVSHAIVKELIKAGVDTVFGIVSIHNMPIYDAIYEEGSIRIVTARGESGAVNMADAYARTTGKLGVVITSTGAGAGNAAGSLTETWNAGIPLLHITGEVDTQYIGTDQRYIHECKDQTKMMQGAGKEAHLLKLPRQVVPFMRKAIAEAQTVPKGPVTVSIPTNYQMKVIPKNDLVEIDTNKREQEDLSLPEELLEKIATAKRPIVWVGEGIIHAGATEELLKLVETIQPAVVTSESGKGSLPESHPLCIGNFTATPQFSELLSKTDLLISIGVRFRGGETFEGTLPYPKNHINIDANIKSFNRNVNVKHSIIADAKTSLVSINRFLADREIVSDGAYIDEIKTIKEEVRKELRSQVAPYDQFAQVLQDELPDDAILVNDVTISGYTWGNKLIDVEQPRQYLHMAGGGIGQGLPMAIGAKIGQPKKPVVLIAGDGGFMLNAGEMITATQEQAPVIILLFDDGGYGILKYYQEAAYNRRVGVDLINPDFVQLAKSMGFEANHITSIDQFEKGFTAALNSNQSYIFVIDMEKVGPLEYEDSPEYIESFHPQED